MENLAHSYILIVYQLYDNYIKLILIIQARDQSGSNLIINNYNYNYSISIRIIRHCSNNYKRHLPY